MRMLDRRIDIERKDVTSDEYGQEVPGWTKIAQRRPAAVRPVRGDERFEAEQFVARQQTEFIMRWALSIAELSPLDRIIYPAGMAPTDAEIYDIIEVVEVGRREGFRVVAARRAEVSGSVNTLMETRVITDGESRLTADGTPRGLP